ncbi:NAD(P)H-dependent oxidoreductase subunit E, partial [Acidithiobacillus ferrooxidans]|nr:NAD(P)H-dependent oxidoreductase subunit E [Acidithiobacillus ferrooxidans]
LGACKDAPMLQVGDHYYENLTQESLDALLAKLRGESDDVR